MRNRNGDDHIDRNRRVINRHDKWYTFVLHNRRRARKVDIVNLKLPNYRRLVKSALFHPFGDFEYSISRVANLVASKRIFVSRIALVFAFPPFSNQKQRHYHERCAFWMPIRGPTPMPIDIPIGKTATPCDFRAMLRTLRDRAHRRKEAVRNVAGVPLRRHRRVGGPHKAMESSSATTCPY